MPSRIVSLLIVVFWLACMSWLFVREVWPRLISGEPPPFAIDRMDNTVRNPLPIVWVATVKSGSQERTYAVTTRVVWDRDTESYSFRFLLEQPPGKNLTSGLERMASIYHVDSEGRMAGFTADANYNRLGVPQSVSFDGTVQGGDCSIVWSVTSLRDRNRGIAEVQVSRTGTVLLPLHPLPRIRGLTPGRRWGLPMLNPLVVPAAPGTSPRVVWVNAEVRTASEWLEWNRQNVACHVIDYEGEDVQGSVWVEDAEDARVLRIEFRLGDDEWTIVRQ